MWYWISYPSGGIASWLGPLIELVSWYDNQCAHPHQSEVNISSRLPPLLRLTFWLSSRLKRQRLQIVFPCGYFVWLILYKWEESLVGAADQPPTAASSATVATMLLAVHCPLHRASITLSRCHILSVDSRDYSISGVVKVRLHNITEAHSPPLHLLLYVSPKAGSHCTRIYLAPQTRNPHLKLVIQKAPSIRP